MLWSQTRAGLDDSRLSTILILFRLLPVAKLLLFNFRCALVTVAEFVTRKIDSLPDGSQELFYKLYLHCNCLD